MGVSKSELAHLILLFVIIKIANITLMQYLTDLTQRRWARLVIVFTNLALFFGLVYVKNQTTIDEDLIMYTVLLITTMISIVFFIRNYRQQISKGSL
jgi:hypothetical protein